MIEFVSGVRELSSGTNLRECEGQSLFLGFDFIDVRCFEEDIWTEQR
jgi:hypothetical protein